MQKRFAQRGIRTNDTEKMLKLHNSHFHLVRTVIALIDYKRRKVGFTWMSILIYVIIDITSNNVKFPPPAVRSAPNSKTWMEDKPEVAGLRYGDPSQHIVRPEYGSLFRLYAERISVPAGRHTSGLSSIPGLYYLGQIVQRRRNLTLLLLYQ